MFLKLIDLHNVEFRLALSHIISYEPYDIYTNILLSTGIVLQVKTPTVVIDKMLEESYVVIKSL